MQETRGEEASGMEEPMAGLCKDEDVMDEEEEGEEDKKTKAEMAEVDWVDGLKVVQLKKELKARGEPTSGRKSELVIRLKEKLKGDEKAADDLGTNTEEHKQVEEKPAADVAPEIDTTDQNDADNAAQVAKTTEEASKVEDEKPTNGGVAAADPTDQAVADAAKQQPEKQKEIPTAEESGKPTVEMTPLDGEPEIDDILGEDEMDDMAFELEPTPKGKRRRSQATRSTTAEKATQDTQSKTPAKPEGKDQTGTKVPADPSKDDMETDLPDGEHPEKTQEPQGDNLAPDGVKEGSAKDGTGSELKKRKLDEDVRASVDASNSGSLESASKRKRIPIPVPGTKPLDVTKPITQEPAPLGLRKSTSLGQSQLEKTLSGVPPTPKQKSCALRINNFVRPFSEKNCRDMLEQYGKVVDMWLASIKTHCYVVYETEEQALKAFNATYNTEWPIGGRKLIPYMVQVDEAKREIERGRARSISRGGAAAELQGVSNAGYARTSGAVGIGPDSQMERIPSGPQAPGGPYRRPINRPVTLEDLFFKTHTKPPLYYLPLTDEQILAKRRQEAKGVPNEIGRGERVKDIGIGNTNGIGHKGHHTAHTQSVESREQIQRGAP